jgi:threonine dehydratase
VKEHVLAEPAGAATTAAWLSESSTGQDGPKVLVVSAGPKRSSVRSSQLCMEMRPVALIK